MLSLISILAITVSAVLPEGLVVDVRLDPPEIPFHKQATLTITVEAPADMAFDIQSMTERLAGLNASGETLRSTEVVDGGRVRIRDTYILDAVYTGLYALEPVNILIDGDTGITVPSPVLTVRELTDAELEEAQQADLTLPEFTPKYQRPWWKRMELWAGLVALLLIAWLIYRSQRTAPSTLLETGARLPWDVALERLNNLERRCLLEKGQHDRYYVDLTAILRYYIEGRYHLHAAEQTTPEFLADVSFVSHFNEAQEKFLTSFLRQCDRVKFAKLIPERSEAEQHFSEVKGFVESTIPQPEPETEVQAA